MDLEQPYVIQFLDRKGLKLEPIAAELSSTYGQDADERSSIKYRMDQLKVGRTNLKTLDVGGRPALNDIDAEIFSLLRKYPFASICIIAEALAIPASTVYSHLIERMRFRNYLLRWIPHVLTEELRKKRVDLSKESLQLLESQQRFGFRDIVTRDEFWFLQNYEHRQIWCLPGDEVTKRVIRTIATPKEMLTVFLGVDGVVFTDWLPDGERFNSDYFCIHVLQPLAAILHRR
jgi:hypothetical protein